MKIKLPPGLYKRVYLTRGGYKQVLFYVRFTDWTGRRRTFPGIDNLQLANEELTRLKELNRQRFDFNQPAPTRSSLFAWADKWLDLKSDKLSAATDATRVQHLKDHLGDRRLQDINTSRMLAYRKKRAAEGRSPATINREMAALRSILLLAYHDGVLEKKPFLPFEREHNERYRVASDQEYREILQLLRTEAVGDNPMRVYYSDAADVVEILWEMGFRLGEVLAIRPSDLMMNERMIAVARIREKEGLKRPLPSSPRAWEILSRRAGRMKTDSRLFLPTRHMIRYAFQNACEELEIRGLWVHDLRATFGTRKTMDGWDRKLIRTFTGHRTDYAFSRYVRPTDEALRRFIGAVEPAKQPEGTMRADEPAADRPQLRLVGRSDSI